MVAELLFWQTEDSPHFWNYRRRFIVNLSSENPMKSWEIIADDLSKAGWSWGCVSAVDLADE
jgi:hypothetical protein